MDLIARAGATRGGVGQEGHTKRRAGAQADCQEGPTWAKEWVRGCGQPPLPHLCRAINATHTGQKSSDAVASSGTGTLARAVFQK